MWYYYSAGKKNEIFPSATKWMDLEDTVLSEIKSDRERQIPYIFTYMWNLKNKVHRQNRNKPMDTENRLKVADWRRCGGLGEKGEGIKKHKLVVTKQLQNSHGEVNSIENIVNGIIITVHGAQWVLELVGKHFLSYIND